MAKPTLNEFTALEEDNLVGLVAEKLARKMIRRTVVEIDENALDPRWKSMRPDYQRIERALRDGMEIPGAVLTGRVEFVLVEPKALCENGAGPNVRPAS